MPLTRSDDFKPSYNPRSSVTPARVEEEAVVSYSNGVETVDGSFSISFKTLLKRPPNPEKPMPAEETYR